MSEYYRMAAHSGASSARSVSVKLLASYTFDWIVLIAMTVVGGFLGRIEPNKRPFALDDVNISFPFTEKETVPSWLLVVLCALCPVIVILVVSLVLVPGSTVPSNTSQAYIWKRKLWELHVGWLGLLMAVGSSFFFVSGIKNMYGKPRPDLLSRCQPDLANAARYLVGGLDGLNGSSSSSRLYSGDICQQPDAHKLDDGFRSYPSGHSAASAAGLLYLSLSLASKFSVTLPFVVPASAPLDDSMHVAFPSRMAAAAAAANNNNNGGGGGGGGGGHDDDDGAHGDFPPSPSKSSAFAGAGAGAKQQQQQQRRYNSRLASVRRQAAAPPVYLLAITIVPFCLAIFIAASRWFDFRHHGFDILFGFLIGIVTAVYSFRYYHLPIAAGAGWAWGPRSDDRAFWAGVGRLGYAGHNYSDSDSDSYGRLPRRRSPGESGDVDVDGSSAGAAGAALRANNGQAFQFQDVELHRMDKGHSASAPGYGHAQ